MWNEGYTSKEPVPVRQDTVISPDTSDSTTVGDTQLKPHKYHMHQIHAYGPPEAYPDTPYERDEACDPEVADIHPSSQPPYPRNDQRTILITNLPTNVTHKDLVDVVRGGRLLDVFLRNDRAATISFVEGAQDFLAYAKRNDIYIHAKRVSTNPCV
jgi:hypothetical protein